MNPVGVICERCGRVMFPPASEVTEKGLNQAAIDLGWLVIHYESEDAILWGSTEHYCPRCRPPQRGTPRGVRNRRRNAEILRDMAKAVASLEKSLGGET